MNSIESNSIENDILERGLLVKSRGQAMLIVMLKEKYDMMKNLILKEESNLKFYITSESDSHYYTYVVYHKSTPAQKINGITFLRPCSTYLENIKWIWKRGKLHEMHNFKGWQEWKSIESNKSDNALTVLELEKMDINEIKGTLCLKDYECWLRIRELENKIIN